MVVGKFTLFGSDGASAAQPPTAGKNPSVMGSRGGDEQQPWHFALDRRASLRIAAREFEMDGSHSQIRRSGGGRSLLGNPSPIIGEIRIHTRHPPMAAAVRRAQCESLNHSYPHIIDAAVNRLT